MHFFCINPQYRLDLPQKYAFFTQINKENNVESTVTQGMPITTTTTFIIYILFMLGVGLYAAKFTRNLSDFILGGRRLGSFVTGLSASASDMSGWLLMGLPGALYVSGVCESWIAIGLTIGAYFNWKLVAGRLRIYTEHANNSLTLPDYFVARFNDTKHITSLLASVIILFFFVFYCGSGMVAGAKLFVQTFDIDYTNALYIGAAATIFYVFVGGFLAVSWTDTIQATLMLFALFVTPIMVIIHLGGFDATFTALSNYAASAEGPDGFNSMVTSISAIAIISSLAWGLGYMGQPHILVRFMAASSVKAIPNARRVSISWMAICLLGACLVGYFGRAYMLNGNLTGALQDPEKIFIFCAQQLFSPWIAGILLSAILAAIMSTLSCQLLVASSTLTEDFYKRYFRKHASQRELVWCGRAMILLVSFIAFLIARDENSKILGVVSYAWAGFGASFGPVVLISLFWRRMNKFGAFAGMLAGAISVIGWDYFGTFMRSIGCEWGGVWDVYCLLPAFIVASIAIFVVSIATTHSENGRENIKFFDALKNEYHARLGADD